MNSKRSINQLFLSPLWEIIIDPQLQSPSLVNFFAPYFLVLIIYEVLFPQEISSDPWLYYYSAIIPGYLDYSNYCAFLMFVHVFVKMVISSDPCFINRPLCFSISKTSYSYTYYFPCFYFSHNPALFPQFPQYQIANFTSLASPLLYEYS